MTSHSIENTVLKTLAYFDVHNYPLTLLELHAWLYQPEKDYSAGAVLESLDMLVRQKKVEECGGYYFLTGRKDLLPQRLNRYLIADKKFKRALKVTKWLRQVPGVNMVAVANTLALSNATQESDIDFFIIASPRRIWVARGITVIILKLFHLRPQPSTKMNKIDVSFWVSQDHLDISDLRLDQDDIYFHYWLAQLVPLYDRDKAFKKFKDQNAWLNDYLPNADSYSPIWRRQIKAPGWFHRWVEFLTSNLDEKIYRAMQLKIMNPKIKAMMNKDTRVVINDKVLKFHTYDGRPEFREKWQAKLKELKLV
ncbi:MAG: hypothetical protein COT81_05760 [Candidatus Buchananbacteria bacterium CG10_big_fil_rev_8_21_14_0_10_42_9]|uniref:Polymerase nucleotidyl transferase domain-containing protein n=1 Tax=Candidatus Buchananbacteria bacterium CG10_big_fil_rev_8_21_14_0_10_42_9 TaxID=1974526 RepID=A0A2H0VZN1_9BACT|nr:MAG: hypothetical protein COT81_05760 [Candidatus Buchananbacteria bacterium CG10_big_fil_rev_8_21_14_0_10_42_9]